MGLPAWNKSYGDDNDDDDDDDDEIAPVHQKCNILHECSSLRITRDCT